MSFGIYSYLATILIFCGLALVLYFVAILLKRKDAVLNWKDWKIVCLTVTIFIVLTGPEEYFALSWRTWEYNSQRTFHVTIFGAEVETYLFIAFVGFVVSVATLVYAKHEDKKHNS